MWKIGMIGAVVFAIQKCPSFDEEKARSVVSWPLGGEIAEVTQWVAWDAAHYLELSVHGYKRGSASNAFYPLWPWVVKVVCEVTGGNRVVVALALAHLFSILALFGIVWLGSELVDSRVGIRAAVLAMAWPGSLFFSCAYTEALFVMLAVTFFCMLISGRIWIAGWIAAFLPITRAVGIGVLLVIMVDLMSRRAQAKQYCVLLLPLLGYACYFGYMYMETGDWLEGFRAQRFYPTQPAVEKLFGLEEFLRTLVLEVSAWHAPRGSILDRLMFGVWIVVLPMVWRLNKAMFVYVLWIGSVSAVTTEMISFTRHFVTCIPVSIAIAAVWQKSDVSWYCLLAICGAIQVVLLGRYVNFMWAG